MADKPNEPTTTVSEPSLGSLPPSNPDEIMELLNGRIVTLHYSAIGRIAGGWAYFESVIDWWLHDLAGMTTEIGVCFTGQMIGLRPRLDAYIALVRHLGADKKWNPMLEEFARDAQGLAEQRNRAVHDVWDLEEPTEPKRHEATARRTVRVLKVHTSGDQLLALERNIIDLWWRFQDQIAFPIAAELRSSPQQ